MPVATNNQIELFKQQYCISEDRRLAIRDDFNVMIESYEELLPGNTIRSYANGNREINNAFIIFKVWDIENDIIYYPVFSESVGRQMVRAWNLQLPRKMSVFVDGENGNGGNHVVGRDYIQRNEDNRNMLQLIQFARSMMILHVNNPSPMKDPFKSIYEKFETHPRYAVFAKDIKSINTAISNFLQSTTNTENENFENLQQYIVYLQETYPNRNLRNYNFEILRNRIMQDYPNENIVF